MDAAVEFRHVDIVFGAHRRGQDHRVRQALDLLDLGHGRQEIFASTGMTIGSADTNLSIAKGEIFVLMGLSGSGKSTLLRAVNGLNPIARGQLRIAHEDRSVNVARCDSATLRSMRMHRIAMVFQQFALMPWRSVRDNVGFGLELRGTTKAERRRIVDEKLALVGLSEHADRFAGELSGGMQQRVGLARAFATDADILLMDEPFSALDPLIRSKLQDELLELQRRFQKTIIFVSHDLDEALKIGTHIAILEGGKVVQTGTPVDIVLHPVNDYVREFVQHMNPLKVLRGDALMTSLDGLTRADDGSFFINRYRDMRLRVSGEGTASQVTVAGVDRPLVHIAAERGTSPGLGEVAVAPADTPIRTLLLLRQATGHAIVLTEAGRVVGVCTADDIMRTLLGAPRA